MGKQINEKLLEQLISRCEDAMTNLQLSIEKHDIRAAKESLSRAETFRDALDSIAAPLNSKKSGEFVNLKDRLYEATANGSFELDKLQDFSGVFYNSRNVYGMFGSSALNESEYVSDDFNFPSAPGV